MDDNDISPSSQLCQHEFPHDVEQIGFATVLDGKGGRDHFLIEQSRCLQCHFMYQRWTIDPSFSTPDLESTSPEESEG